MARELKQCPLCLSDDINVAFGHDCPYDIIKRGMGGEYVATRDADNVDRDYPKGNGRGRGGYGPAKASPRQIKFAIDLGLPEHIANAMTSVSAREHIDRLLEERKRNGSPVANRGATDRQKEFINNLLSERPGAWNGDVDSLSGNDASALIKQLLATPKASSPKKVEIDDGFYVDDDNVIYKVQRAVHGSGNLYAKVLDTDTGTFDYVSGAIRTLSTMVTKGNAQKLTLDKAKELGHLYGRCIVCGRTLTDEISIANGIGPICAKRF